MAKNKQVKAVEQQTKRSMDDFLQDRIIRIAELITRFATRSKIEKSYGLRKTDFRIMNLLDQTQGLSMSEIARRIHTDKAWVSRSLTTLTERGLVKRQNQKSNPRLSMINLTRKGRSRLEKVRPIAQAYEEVFLAGINDKNFKNGLDRLLLNIEIAFDEKQ